MPNHNHVQIRVRVGRRIGRYRATRLRQFSVRDLLRQSIPHRNNHTPFLLEHVFCCRIQPDQLTAPPIFALIPQPGIELNHERCGQSGDFPVLIRHRGFISSASMSWLSMSFAVRSLNATTGAAPHFPAAPHAPRHHRCRRIVVHHHTTLPRHQVHAAQPSKLARHCPRPSSIALHARETKKKRSWTAPLGEPRRILWKGSWPACQLTGRRWQSNQGFVLSPVRVRTLRFPIEQAPCTAPSRRECGDPVVSFMLPGEFYLDVSPA